MKRKIVEDVVFITLIILIIMGCKENSENGSKDSGTDTDGDVDADADVDVDSDVDSDGDTDSESFTTSETSTEDYFSCEVYCEKEIDCFAETTYDACIDDCESYSEEEMDCLGECIMTSDCMQWKDCVEDCLQPPDDFCPGYQEGGDCCKISDPCGWANDNMCDCEGYCEWDSADCE